MQNYPILLDIHTHSIASRDTVTDMARAAADRSLKVLGISDHGPKTPGAGSSSYFRGLCLAPRSRFGVSLLYGAELNILNEKGDVDLEDSIIAPLSACTTRFFRAGAQASRKHRRALAARAQVLPVQAALVRRTALLFVIAAQMHTSTP